MQQSPQMIPVAPSFPPANISTEQIQKYLDENKKLILAILDNQNLGKLAECAQYQAQLQRNLMYLAAIADAQPQAPTAPPQVAPHPAMQQGAYFMQHHQAAMTMAQKPGGFPPKLPQQFSNPNQMQEQLQQQQQMHQQQQGFQGQMGLRPAGINIGMQPLQAEIAVGGGNAGGPSPNDPRGGGKQDGPSPNDPRGGGKQDAADAEGHGISLAGNAGGAGTDEAK